MFIQAFGNDGKPEHYQDATSNNVARDVVREAVFLDAVPRVDFGKQRHQLCGFCGEALGKEVIYRIVVVQRLSEVIRFTSFPSSRMLPDNMTWEMGH